MAKDQDKHLEDYLSGKDGLSAIYAQSRAEEPSESVDKNILQAAQAAVSKNSAGSGPFSGSWLIPAALAAVLVLAVGITLTLEKPGVNEALQPERYSPTSPAAEADKAKKVTSGKPASLKESARTQSGAGDTREDADALLRSRPAPAAEPEPASTEDTENKPVQSPPAAATVLEAPQESPARMSAPAESTAGGQQKSQSGTVSSQPQTAERWLQSIQALVQENKTDEARAQLKDFRRVYPDYPLPVALQKLL